VIELPIKEFGHHLITTLDLDPVYVALRSLRSSWGDDRVKRHMLAYFTFYSTPVACHMSTLTCESYWAEMRKAAANTTPSPVGGRWPRGVERRHCRGASGIQCVDRLATRYPRPEEFFDSKKPSSVDVPFEKVKASFESEYLFGPWISFKACDITERVFDWPIVFPKNVMFFFDAPRKAALMHWSRMQGYAFTATPDNEEEALAEALKDLLDTFSSYPAPPTGNRPCGVQEVETVLCKWKSHVNGHYPLNHDIDEITGSTIAWAAAGCKASQEFMKHFPKDRT
jgi:hypothetical protein